MFSLTFECALLRITRTMYCKNFWYNKGYLVVETAAGNYRNFTTANGRVEVARFK